MCLETPFHSKEEKQTAESQQIPAAHICFLHYLLTLLTLAIQPQRQLATEQEKRETNMHTNKQAKTRLDVDARMIDDGLYDRRLLRS